MRKKYIPYDQFKALHQARLNSPEWQEIRKQMFIKALGRCDQCNDLTDLDKSNIHHYTYERLGCELLDDLGYLCKECHRRQHDPRY